MHRAYAELSPKCVAFCILYAKRFIICVAFRVLYAIGNLVFFFETLNTDTSMWGPCRRPNGIGNYFNIHDGDAGGSLILRAGGGPDAGNAASAYVRAGSCGDSNNAKGIAAGGGEACTAA